MSMAPSWSICDAAAYRDTAGRNASTAPGVMVLAMADWNATIFAEFRATEGRVGGGLAGHHLALLHHRGAKSGMERVSPLAVQKLEDDTWAVFGSKGGAPTNPAWSCNVQAHPDVEIELGTETIPVRARVATGDERERIWSKQ